ncbi:MAG TPA: AMP-binding protein [Mariprofundaceae bacterium]|nr:AMP-binding protein [Mariprofundaceae bacterium]
MSRVIDGVRRFAVDTPQAVALEGLNSSDSLTYSELVPAIEHLAAALKTFDIHACALLADNTPAWAVADLAAISAGIPLIPVPHFFAPSQMVHLLHSSGVNAILTDRPEPVAGLLAGMHMPVSAPVEVQAGKEPLSAFILSAQNNDQPKSLPEACAKVTFTSGSTGDPKGVCLTQLAMETVAGSLASATEACAEDRHLSALPYATLLENIGGLYAPLMVGATICTPGLAAVGLSGSSGLDVKQFVSVLNERRISTCIMIPQMLHGLIAGLEAGMPRPANLRYIAVGGAPVSEFLLTKAETLGLPVFEGYGLSEAASVVAVNRPGESRPGSVGKPLPHVDLNFADDGEILVRGSLFSGYLGDAEQPVDAFLPTGDIGQLDKEGFLHLTGRKKHLFITAFGRNVSPEWVERELTIEPAVGQACVFGEARPFNVAVIQPRAGVEPAVVKAAIQQAVDAANARLPDYARVSHWLLAREPFTVTNGLWTGTGRPRRQFIFKAYEHDIDGLYKEFA